MRRPDVNGEPDASLPVAGVGDQPLCDGVVWVMVGRRRSGDANDDLAGFRDPRGGDVGTGYVALTAGGVAKIDRARGRVG
jgi:hypothetical protein